MCIKILSAQFVCIKSNITLMYDTFPGLDSVRLHVLNVCLSFSMPGMTAIRAPIVNRL